MPKMKLILSLPKALFEHIKSEMNTTTKRTCLKVGNPYGVQRSI